MPWEVDTAPNRVSVVIPFYNSRATLYRAVDSALAQSGVVPEVIVVDDGSTDGSQEIIAPIRGLVTHIRQPNTGPAAARNTGLSAATAEYVAFLDADDYWLQGFLMRATAFLVEHPACGVVSTASYRFDGKHYLLRPAILGVSPDSMPTGVLDDFFTTYGRFWHVATGAVVMRREIVDAVGPMRPDLAFAEDMEFWLRLACATPWGFIAEPFLVYDRSATASLSAVWQEADLLPDLESWRSSISPILKPEDQAGFGFFCDSWARGLLTRLLVSGHSQQARRVSESGFIVRRGLASVFAGCMNRAPTAVWQVLSLVARAKGATRKVRGKLLNSRRGRLDGISGGVPHALMPPSIGLPEITPCECGRRSQ